MSKKQQVEKVQKCSVVVSAFKEGLRVPPASSPTNHTEGSGEEGEGPAEASTPPNQDEKEEVEEKGANGSKAGPSTSQQASAPPRAECCLNKKSWSRLRDGKGVEPEDLDKSHQLTPAAFVRPKRDADDDQPVEVALDQREQVRAG